MYTKIFEHQDFIVISKDPEINFHKEDEEYSLFEKLSNDFNGEKFFPVHRIDKMTSGLLLIARSSGSAALLTKLFEEKKVQKEYLALSDRKPKKKQGTVSGDMERSRRKSWRLLRSTTNPAITTFVSMSMSPGVRLFLCRPITGKTHQIRVALKSVGAPIIGDIVYGGTPSDRGYLHAFRLSFSYDGEEFSFESFPEYGSLFKTVEFTEALNGIRKLV